MKYYIIHGIIPERKQRLEKELESCGVRMEDVTWIERPNKNEITPQMSKELFKPGPVHGTPGPWICVTYKHYLALSDMVANSYELAIIMEDNVSITDCDLPETINEWLRQLPEDWDVLFDGNWLSYARLNPAGVPYPNGQIEEYGEKIRDGKLVYRKGNTSGGTRAARFYMLNLDCAKKLHYEYVPFNNIPDHWMNELFRKLDIHSYWSEPCVSTLEENHLCTS